MASADRRPAVGWLLALVQLTFLAQLSPSAASDIMWPTGISDFELWDQLHDLTPAIDGNPLRTADLAIRMVQMDGERFGGPAQTRIFHRNPYDECK